MADSRIFDHISGNHWNCRTLHGKGQDSALGSDEDDQHGDADNDDHCHDEKHYNGHRQAVTLGDLAVDVRGSTVFRDDDVGVIGVGRVGRRCRRRNLGRWVMAYDIVEGEFGLGHGRTEEVFRRE